ncbi:MAG: hypothetical protein WCS20_18190 [Alphaproteobacteria bacterium]|jgi:hypothetical protein
MWTNVPKRISRRLHTRAFDATLIATEAEVNMLALHYLIRSDDPDDDKRNW